MPKAVISFRAAVDLPLLQGATTRLKRPRLNCSGLRSLLRYGSAGSEEVLFSSDIIESSFLVL